MKLNLINRAFLMFLATGLTLSHAWAAPYAKGDKVEAFRAEDQHGNAFDLQPESTHYLLVSHDMETGKKANSILTNLGKDYLTSNKSIYIANIYGMPGIGRMFAIPKMRKYTHRIILADDEALISRFPAQAGKVTVLTLIKGEVQSIRYWDPTTEAVDGYLK